MDATSLRMLIELATTARDAAAAKRAQCAAAVEAARQQLKLLQGYAADYDRRAQVTLANGADIAAQNNLQAFAGKLQRALEQQGNETRRREQVLAVAEHEFIESQRKLKSLQALQERGLAQARQAAVRREQKAVDEMAQGMFARSERPLATNGW